MHSEENYAATSNTAATQPPQCSIPMPIWPSKSPLRGKFCRPPNSGYSTQSTLQSQRRHKIHYLFRENTYVASLTSFVLKSMKFDQRLLCTSVSGLHSEAFGTFFVPIAAMAEELALHGARALKSIPGSMLWRRRSARQCTGPLPELGNSRGVLERYLNPSDSRPKQLIVHRTSRLIAHGRYVEVGGAGMEIGGGSEAQVRRPTKVHPPRHYT